MHLLANRSLKIKHCIWRTVLMHVFMNCCIIKFERCVYSRTCCILYFICLQWPKLPTRPENLGCASNRVVCRTITITDNNHKLLHLKHRRNTATQVSNSIFLWCATFTQLSRNPTFSKNIKIDKSLLVNFH